MNKTNPSPEAGIGRSFVSADANGDVQIPGNSANRTGCNDRNMKCGTAAKPCSKRFLFGQGPERMQINTELMKLWSDKPSTLQEYYFLIIRRSISKNEYFSLKYKIKSE
ncbi:MAG: hypothetical protein PHQ02_09115 [Candidatus Riflebacteria bacterium]|nr:hypothetical protein [Candidatus Riflebacteria bacterium]